MCVPGLAFWAFWGAVVSFGGTAAHQVQTSVSGRVIEAGATAGVGGAIVTLAPAEGTPRPNSILRVIANDAGVFTLLDVPAGTYRLSASAPGYVSGVFGQQRPNDLGLPVRVVQGRGLSTLTIRLWKLAAISGAAREASGRPLARHSIHALRKTSNDGKDSFVLLRTVTTDTGGNYELTRLMAGKYIIIAGPGRSAPETSYPSTFYPGVLRLSEASTLEVDYGQALAGIDIVVPRDHLTSVSGVLVGHHGEAAGIDIVLRPSDGDTLPGSVLSTQTKTRADGTFVVGGVPAGSYTATCVVFPKWPETGTGRRVSDSSARATRSREPLAPLPMEPTLWARVPIAVGEKPLTGVQLALLAGHHVDGQIVFTGTRERPSPLTLTTRAVHIAAADDAALGPFPAGRIEEDGSFRLAGMPPGRYMIGLQPGAFEGWHVASVTIDNREVGGRLFDLRSPTAGVRITLTDTPATIAGRLMTSDTGLTNATVLAFADDESVWADSTELGGSVLRMPATPDHTYQMIGVLPGRYRIIAVSGNVPDNWRDSRFLRSLVARSTAVTVGRSAQINQDLHVVLLK